jgi:hypothetical protein
MIVPRYNGVDADGVAQTEADHFMKCPGCGQWFDMRDLGQVLEHVHDGDIEIVEGSAPPAHKDQFTVIEGRKITAACRTAILLAAPSGPALRNRQRNGPSLGSS